MNIVEEINKGEMERISQERPIPEFAPGDTLKVHVKVVEGTRERVQVFEGVCIARKANSINSNFTVRKISYGEGVERIFPLYSPRIDKIEVMRRGKVRRAKLNYIILGIVGANRPGLLRKSIGQARKQALIKLYFKKLQNKGLRLADYVLPDRLVICHAWKHLILARP